MSNETGAPAPARPSFEVAGRQGSEAATGLVVLAVNLQEDPETVGEYLRTLNVALTTVLDRDGAVTKQYRVTGLPMTVAVDRAGSSATSTLGHW